MGGALFAKNFAMWRVVACFAWLAVAASNASKPHIFFMLYDDWGYANLGSRTFRTRARVPKYARETHPNGARPLPIS
jgi:hypothetical protein